MDVLQELFDEIQRIQCLVCAFRHDGSRHPGFLPTRELIEILRISPSECSRVVSSLTSEGLFETVSDALHPLPRGLRLTDDGRRYLRCFSASLPRRSRGVLA